MEFSRQSEAGQVGWLYKHTSSSLLPPLPSRAHTQLFSISEVQLKKQTPETLGPLKCPGSILKQQRTRHKYVQQDLCRPAPILTTS